MIKHSVIFALILAIFTTICSCTLLTKPIDKDIHFSDKLSKLENSIRNIDWEQADKNLETANKAWRGLKPWLQVDIDHDYVHEMEENFAKLEAYINTKEQAEALAHILLIQETWEDIESL